MSVFLFIMCQILKLHSEISGSCGFEYQHDSLAPCSVLEAEYHRSISGDSDLYNFICCSCLNSTDVSKMDCFTKKCIHYWHVKRGYF
jgi:hypothetical protein